MRYIIAFLLSCIGAIFLLAVGLLGIHALGPGGCLVALFLFPIGMLGLKAMVGLLERLRWKPTGEHESPFSPGGDVQLSFAERMRRFLGAADAPQADAPTSAMPFWASESEYRPTPPKPWHWIRRLLHRIRALVHGGKSSGTGPVG